MLFSIFEDANQVLFRLQNLDYFLRHGVIFSKGANISYGVTISGDSFPGLLVARRHAEEARRSGFPDIAILHRTNEGFDFGAHAAMLDFQCDMKGLKPKCHLPYDAFIFFNDGLRGPFLPSYMPKDYHWSQAFLDKLTALSPSPCTAPNASCNVALVGTSIACLSRDDEAVTIDASFFGPKVEGFAFAITREALAYIRQTTSVFSAHENKRDAIISGEYNLTRTVLLAPQRWQVTSMLLQHEGLDFRDQRTWDCNSYLHPSRTASYGPGNDVAPLEVIFHKARWHNGDRVAEAMMNSYTLWQDRNVGNYESSVQWRDTDSSPLLKALLKKNYRGNPSKLRSNKSGPSTLVSYVVGGSKFLAHQEGFLTSNISREVDVCDDNLETFLKRGYVPNTDVDFAITFVADRKPQRSIQELSRVFTNVFIFETTWNCGVDLCQHQSVVEKMRIRRTYSEFIFLNCGARGPYSFDQGIGSQGLWYRQVRQTLKEYDALGPTISPEIGYHLQTYMIALSNRSIHFIDSLWHRSPLSQEIVLEKLLKFNLTDERKQQIRKLLELNTLKPFRIAAGELGLSFVLLSHEKKILGTCFDARTSGVLAGEGTNPTVCFKDASARNCFNPNATSAFKTDCVRCPQLEPSECMFVKFGGEIFRQQLQSPWTYERVSAYDRRKLGYRLKIAM